MTFKEQLISDMAVFFNSGEFADAVTYSPVSGDDVSCSVVVDHDVLIQADGYEVGVATLGTTIDALVADVGTVNRGDTFTIDSTTYTVVRQDANDGTVVKVVVK